MDKESVGLRPITIELELREWYMLANSPHITLNTFIQLLAKIRNKLPDELIEELEEEYKNNKEKT